VNSGPRGPPKPEKANRDTESSNKGRLETFFRSDFPLFIEHGLLDIIEVCKEGYDYYEATDKDAHEGETFLAQIETIDTLEYDCK
jgi:hypothetical protein